MAKPPVETPQTNVSSLREHVLDVATELFYRRGIRAVGVDTVVAEAAVAKTSLYRFFPTKDALIAAFLERRDGLFWAHWDKVAGRTDEPRRQLLSQLKWISEYIGSHGFRGCPFLNAATEFPDEEHPGRAVCRANKEQLRTRLEALARKAGARQPRRLADQLLLLIDGAFANTLVLGASGPYTELVRAGETLIDAAL